MKHLIGIIVSAIALGVAAWLVPGIIVGAYHLDNNYVTNSSVEKRASAKP